MLVGLTFDLRDEYLAAGYSEEQTAEFDQPVTIEAIESALRSLGYRTDRIGGIHRLAGRLVGGDRWDIVFNIAEGMFGAGREAQVPALLDAYQIPYTFSDPLVLALALHKGTAKRLVRDLGLPTPDFVVVSREEDVNSIKLDFPLFCKPLAEGTGKGVTAASRVENREELRGICRHLLVTYSQPVLVERFLPGREFTVGIVGTGAQARMIGAMEVILGPDAESHAYSYHNKEHYESLVRYDFLSGEVAESAGDLALAVWRGLDCRDGGRIDLRMDDDGILNFLEVNPLAGLNPIRSDLPILARRVGIEYNQLIQAIMDSAMERVPQRVSSSIRPLGFDEFRGQAEHSAA